MQISDYIKGVFVGYDFNKKEKQELNFSQISDESERKKKPKKKKAPPQYVAEKLPFG
jgi:hypothetical protein